MDVPFPQCFFNVQTLEMEVLPKQKLLLTTAHRWWSRGRWSEDRTPSQDRVDKHKILGANTQLFLVTQTTRHLNLEGNICYKHRLGVIQYLTQEGSSQYWWSSSRGEKWRIILDFGNRPPCRLPSLEPASSFVLGVLHFILRVTSTTKTVLH